MWSKALGINNDDFTPGVPNASDDETAGSTTRTSPTDRPHNFVVNFVYQTPAGASGVLGALANDWQLSGVYRWTSGRPHNVAFIDSRHRRSESDRELTATRTRASS